jgi:hypothetical protein
MRFVGAYLADVAPLISVYVPSMLEADCHWIAPVDPERSRLVELLPYAKLPAAALIMKPATDVGDVVIDMAAVVAGERV